MKLTENSKVLNLVLKREWFDAIFFLGKGEEYRRVCQHWERQFKDKKTGEFKNFNLVQFCLGYQTDRPSGVVYFNGIRQANDGNPEWGAIPGNEYFIISLGRIMLSPVNYTPKYTSYADIQRKQKAIPKRLEASQ